jgi:hypothetical protein
VTTIAFDGRFLAADTLATRAGAIQRPALKIEVQKFEPYGWMAFATSGSYGPMRRAMIRWWAEGQNPHNLPPHNLSDPRDLGYFAVFSAESRQLWTFNHCMPYADEEEAPFSTGSGADHAITAMRCGRIAMDAVIMASIDDRQTNSDVRYIDLEAPERGVLTWAGG